MNCISVLTQPMGRTENVREPLFSNNLEQTSKFYDASLIERAFRRKSDSYQTL